MGVFGKKETKNQGKLDNIKKVQVSTRSIPSM